MGRNPLKKKKNRTDTEPSDPTPASMAPQKPAPFSKPWMIILNGVAVIAVVFYLLFWIVNKLFGLAILFYVSSLLTGLFTQGYWAMTALIVLVGLWILLRLRD